ncbi:MAG TPA: late competence development ComFB family protein [Treponema sp.]|jgi:competence protein ComFB|uniref:late competence development ComFB family protein n=1 Tax=Gracilinema caldarium TaxID=215591 RepID=UPI0016BB1D2D|nr:late competence development ComFB family protein [Gracilinema caldarium]NLJ11337.1 late competence development ComFB family protein [Treponema sp.]HON13564.1 late competence development ComFB family protein [Treponema sp.]HPC70729.1 late competence development ComFB family protein [Treponema sp.]HRS03922.1 late competence development ComFB family protein [Treponema sp.]HRU28400.1 late competence development ComFB family protein [Treponema sp.]
MDIHNTTEDRVLSLVHEIFDSIEKEGKKDRPCTCFQCRLDTACYVLNRLPPKYVVSSRGVARTESETIEKQQEDADIVSLIYEGLHKIAKSLRPHFTHNPADKESPVIIKGPVFNIPTIIGRVFNGSNFEPISNIDVMLMEDGKLAPMIDPNWQNPYRLIPNTAGTFTFWPKPKGAEKAGLEKTFTFSISIQAEGFEPLQHFFSIPVISEELVQTSYSMQRTYKIPDLYLFPPGNDEEA